MSLREFIEKLPRPEDYFSGLSWSTRLMPDEILCFARLRQDHATSGWEGISAKAGRYDQHGRFVLLVSLAGEGKLGVESEIHHLREGAAILLFPHQIHYYVELPEEFCWLFITFELSASSESIDQLRGPARVMNAAMQDKLKTFLENYHAGEALQASALLGEILETHPKMNVSVAEKEGEVSDRSLAARVKRYVMAHLEGDLSNPALANEMRTSESYLRAVFREETGVSLGHFVRSARLVRASYLLKGGDMGMKQISEQCGFQSLTSFTRAFRRTYEMTPSEYRKRFARKDS